MGDKDGELTRYDLVYLLGNRDFVLCRDVLQELGHGQTREMMNDGGWDVMVVRLVDGSMPSPAPSKHEERMKIPAVRINHKNAHIPDPTNETLEALALKGWIDYSGGMQPLVGHEMPSWDDLPEKLREVWIGVAKGQHVVMSLIGGATIEEIANSAE